MNKSMSFLSPGHFTHDPRKITLHPQHFTVDPRRKPTLPRKLIANHNYKETKSTALIEINQLQPTDVTFNPLKGPLEC